MPYDYRLLPHLGIQTLHPYVPGKPIAELKQELHLKDVIKLASNENPLGCSPQVLRALERLSPFDLAQYPAPNLHPLKEALSQKLSISSNQIFLSNGSDFIFNLLLILFALQSPNKHMLTHDKAFMTYSIQAQTLGIPCVELPLLAHWEVDIDALIGACNETTALIFLANPNNPTGLLVPKEGIQKLLASIPQSCILVVDEAYFEFAYPSNADSALPLLDAFPNLVITRTFSKAYGLAGLRLGYAAASETIIDLLQRIQLPFTVNFVALEAALAALRDEVFLENTLKNNQSGLEQVAFGLKKLDIAALPSSCNFITFDCGRPGLSIYQRLLEHGIIVRPLTPYHWDNFLRVTIGSEKDNHRFLSTLAKILSKNQGVKT